MDQLIEGIFRFWDAMQWSLPILLGCDLSNKFVAMGLEKYVYAKYENVGLVFWNFLINFHYMLLDWFVLMADFFFDDYFSVAFWSGDIFYHLMVKENPSP